jgi:uncharacterized protein (UPF0335 family)
MAFFRWTGNALNDGVRGTLMGSGRTLHHTALLAALIVTALLFRSAPARENRKYIHKTTVDTLIQQAFYTLNAVSGDMPGADFRREQALADAKKVAAKLRAMAKGDPNEKYVIWKTGELESQIFLEERDIVLKKLEKSQKERNAIIDVYNKEVGKARPDFIVLQKTVEDMRPWDAAKTEEMLSSMDQRRYNISREVIYKLEKAMIMGDMDKTQREFDYCKKNRSLLVIPADKYDRFEERIRSLGDAIKLKPAVDEQFALSEDYLFNTMLGDAGKCLREIEGMLARIERDLPPRDREDFTARAKRLSSAINRKEDSLIAITYAILAEKGENAALDHVERVLKPCGVSGPKIGRTHTSIMNVATARGRPEDTTMNREIKELSRESDQSGIDFTLVRSAAKKKAQDRADSVRLAEESRLHLLQIEQARADSVRQAAERRAAQAFAENQEKANGVSVQIYTLLEENRIKEACSRFISEKKILEQFLYKDAFFLLESTITQAIEGGAQGKRHAPQPAVAAERAPLPPGPDEDLRRNQEKAQQVSAQIYGLLEANKIEEAYLHFAKVRKPLEKYLCPEAFAMLEVTVLQSYDSSRKRR